MRKVVGMTEIKILSGEIIQILESLLKKSSELNASDIHVDPTKGETIIRLRVDGRLQKFDSLPLEKHSELISRLKILAGLRIDEHFRAQDGRFRFNISENSFFDVRVSILPTYYGENAVLRLLSDQNESLNLGNLGFDSDDLKKIREAFGKSSGMILVTGPTGCGKTTTLYSIIKELNKIEDSIITIEDPIEYAISGVRQIQVDKRGGLDFANGLRSILRQDPNIIMVGEIRDNETASMAINSALTGHLLLSTLHTNDASTSLPRLLDMKIEPFLLASTFRLAINQRLVRKICTNCKIEVEFNDSEKEFINKIIGRTPHAHFNGRGCDHCHGTGFKGRIVIAEVLKNSEEICHFVLGRRPSSEIKRAAKSEGMKTLLQDGLDKIEKGETSLEEVLRAIQE